MGWRDGDRGTRVLGARARRRRDPPGRARRPRPRRGARPHARLGRQPRHRGAGLRRSGPGEPARRDARALPGGRLPGTGEVRLPQRRASSRRDPPTCAAARCSACTRTRRATWCPAEAVHVVPDDVPPERAVLAGTVETAVNALWDARTARRRPGHGRRGGDGRLLRRAAARPDPGRPGHPRRRRPLPGRRRRGARGATSRSRTTRRPVRTSSCTPAPPRPGCSSRSTCSSRRARCVDLSWYGDTEVHALARGAGSTPTGCRSGRARSARWPQPAAVVVRRRSGWPSRSSCCATRRSTCC